MTKSNFDLLPNFKPEEIEATGAKIGDVKFDTIYKLQCVRTQAKRRFVLELNGLTSGTHKSVQHKKGMAVDFELDEKDGPVDFAAHYGIILLGLAFGFCRVGLYWNGNRYSLHFDTGPEFGFWSAAMVEKIVNKKKIREWKYFPLFVDPKTLKV